MADAPGAARGSLARAGFGILLVIAAMAFAMMAFAAERRERALREDAVHTTGTVVGLVRRQKGDAPLVRFATETGEKIDFTVTDPGFSGLRVGEQVSVYYHPDNPGFAGVDTGRTRWQRVALLGGVALVCAFVGVRLTWSTR